MKIAFLKNEDMLENTGQDLYFGHVFLRMRLKMAKGRGKPFCDWYCGKLVSVLKAWQRIKLTISWGTLQGPHLLLPLSP